ncbi:hypothetical protein C8F04DRAFT_1184979 [Mycena alexandri]|uniref:Uncharacterized protein n=1 Tax=Mycena alexandri TaxID=1745969 RepID=A0AAD6SSF1_9AGAR|nr:hypothetical protein C8F04DRAFT_1184979 [Mycena alexandri]
MAAVGRRTASAKINICRHYRVARPSPEALIITAKCWPIPVLGFSFLWASLISIWVSCAKGLEPFKARDGPKPKSYAFLDFRRISGMVRKPMLLSDKTQLLNRFCLWLPLIGQFGSQTSVPEYKVFGLKNQDLNLTQPNYEMVGSPSRAALKQY